MRSVKWLIGHNSLRIGSPKFKVVLLMIIMLVLTPSVSGLGHFDNGKLIEFPGVLASRLHIAGPSKQEMPPLRMLYSSGLEMESTPPNALSNQTIAIIVQDSLYPDVSSAVAQYRQDLDNSGYNTLLYTDPINTHEELKGNLTQWYESVDLVGAVLIGRLPYAQYYHPATGGFWAETFICDLYLMDLDGTWSDDSPINGIYDGHSAASDADIYPEIFVSRIDPSCLSWGFGDAIHVNTYLSRLHNYRTGGVKRQQRALVYIDDDWAGRIGEKWDNDVGLAYPNRTSVTFSTWTNATDWAENRLSQDYQWTHICVHSTSTGHYFGPGGFGEGSAFSSQIREVPPAFNFYNLFACSAAKWTVKDSLAVTYAFSGNYSLAVIGSTKTGGMMDCDYFYSPLDQNETLGESFAHWFSNVLNANSTAGSNYLQWYYGLTIIGDPLLTLSYDCTVLPPIISSLTHSDSSAWYVDSRPEFSWSVPSDVNTISGYFYIIDQNRSTIPTAATGLYTTNNTVQVSTNLNEGTWYLHVVTKDSVDNIGTAAAHYRVNIDLTAPSAEVIAPVAFHNSSVDSVNVVWTAFDSLSGYVLSQVWVDNFSNIIYNGPALNTILTGLTEGSHIINVTIFDAAGNTDSEQLCILVDLTNPTISIISPEAWAGTETNILVEWMASDRLSGYRQAEVRIDDLLRATVYAPNMTVNILGLQRGVHKVNVTAFDWTNRSISAHVFIIVSSGNPWEDFLPVFVVLPIGVHFFRRRRNSHRFYEIPE